jgi:hypothetical protein
MSKDNQSVDNDDFIVYIVRIWLKDGLGLVSTVVSKSPPNLLQNRVQNQLNYN